MKSLLQWALGCEDTKGVPQDISTCGVDSSWRNDRKEAEQLIQSHVSATVDADKFNRILRFSGVRCLGIRVEQKCDVGVGGDMPNQTGIGASDGIMQVEIGQLVVAISIEYDEVAVSAELISNHGPQRDCVDQIEEEAKAGHQPAPNVFIPPIDGSLRAADALIALEDSVARALTEFCESCDIIPKTNHAKPETPFFKMGA